MHEHRDRGAECFTGPYTGLKLNAVGFDLHAAAASIPLLSSRELRVDVVGKQRHAGRQSFENRDERGSVRFAGGGEAQHGAT